MPGLLEFLALHARAQEQRQAPPCLSVCIDRTRCVARTWGAGMGAQCSRAPTQGQELCGHHARQAVSARGLVHGRIDGLVPREKLGAFCKAQASSPLTKVHGRIDGPVPREKLTKFPKPEVPSPPTEVGESMLMEIQPFSGTKQLPEALGMLGRRKKRRNGSCTAMDGKIQYLSRQWQRRRHQSSNSGDRDPEVYGYFASLTNELWLQVLKGLQQREVFRVAVVCQLLNAVTNAPHLYRHLDLRALGRSVGKSGRIRCLSRDACAVALCGFLGQPRFEAVTELDLGGLYLGQCKPEENDILCAAARCCPAIRSLRLGTVEPQSLWSDLARYLPTALERSLRSWWKVRPFTFEAYGRRYELK